MLKKLSSPKHSKMELTEKFQLSFAKAGVLHQVVNSKVIQKKFEFDVHKGNRSKNQKRYEAIGGLVEQFVYNWLEEETGLERIYLPRTSGVKKKSRKTFVFASPDIMTNEDKLLVLIQGSGKVRAGQWSRKLIINESLEHGTQVPYIETVSYTHLTLPTIYSV